MSERTVTTVDGVAIFVGLVVGSGVFFAPQSVAAITTSYSISIALWLVGAFVALCGAYVYATCAKHIPENGGFYAFYRQAFGSRVAVISGFAAVLITYPASLAILSTICADYITPAGVPKTVVAVAALLCAASINAMGIRASLFGQRSMTALKVVVIVALALAALFFSNATTPVASGAENMNTLTVFSVTGAMVAVFWSYSGWSDVTLVAGEIRNPQKSLGTIVLWGVAVVAGLYILIQCAVIYLLGSKAGTSDKVLADAVATVFGAPGARAVSVAVALSIFGALSSLVLVVSRLVVSMANDGWLPKRLGHIHEHRGTPIWALLTVAVLGALYVLTNFQFLITYFTFAIWPFYALAALSLIIVRRRLGEGFSIKLIGAIGCILVVSVGMEISLLSDPIQRQDIMWGALGFILLGALSLLLRQKRTHETL